MKIGSIFMAILGAKKLLMCCILGTSIVVIGSMSPKNAMSLMQQFAVNMATDLTAESCLFSINGPPGTGKTTLLREIFAENIVRRARVLASLSTAAAARATLDIRHSLRCT
jgi:putative protein kinase ArgK-like GTPase of G3E family